MDEAEQKTAVRADCGLNYISAPDHKWSVSSYGVETGLISRGRKKILKAKKFFERAVAMCYLMYAERKDFAVRLGLA